MKERIRFASLNIGEEFEWAGKRFKKLTDRRACHFMLPFDQLIFNGGEVVTHELPDATVFDDDDGDTFSQAYFNWHGFP